MKRFLLLLFIIVFYLDVLGQTNTWTGGATGNWSVPANWTLNHYPIPSEDVVISIACIINVDLPASTIDISSLKITGGFSVTLGCNITSGSKSLRLSSTSATTKGLDIGFGNTLIFDATNASGTCNWICDLTGAIGVTGLINGSLQFAGNGIGAGLARLNVYTSAGANASLVVGSSGSIIYFPDTGDTFSVAGAYLTLQSGAIYSIQKNGGTFPAGAWDPNSIAKALSSGTSIPGFVNGMTYGNLEWNCPLQNASGPNVNVTFNNVKFISTGSFQFRVATSSGNFTMTINGNLDILPAAKIEIVVLTANAGSLGKIILKGNLNNQGTLTTNGAFATSIFEFNGSSNQDITNTGTVSGTTAGGVPGLTFIINNPAGVTLLTPFTLPAKLVLTSGKITTTASNILGMADGGSCPGGGTSTSFVNGPMKKIGRDNFTFPVGTGSIYAPIGMTNVSAPVITDTFTAEYIRTNPQGVHGQTVQTPLNHVSFIEYWTLDRNAASTAIKKISLAVSYTSFCYDLSKTYVSRYDGVQWTYETSGYVSGPSSLPYVSGTITSTSTISTFSPTPNAFTLSTDLPFNANPLPINLITFNAIKLNTTKASTNWELANYCSASAKFEVQREDASKNFVTIGITGGSEANRLYNFIDNDLKNGINYYRLKMIDEGGKISYSRTVAVMNGVNGLLLTSLAPTMVTNSTMLTIAAAKQQKLDLIITDMQGRLVQKQEHTISTGNTSIQIATDRFAAGVYQLSGITAEGRTNTIRFVKQ